MPCERSSAISLWRAAPNLKVLKLQGASGSGAEGVSCSLAPIDAPRLERFVYESSGLDEAVPLELGATTLPALRHLELWLGVPDYGCSTSVSSLAGILGGAGLPRLRSLALKNSEEEDELIEALATSALLPRLESLDLSMGVMSAPTTAALRRHAERFKHLKELELNDNYFSEAEQRSILEVLPMAKFGTQKTEDEPGARYTSVGE